jgi:hypothetical protein
VLTRIASYFFAVNDDDYLLLSPQPPVDSNRELRKVVAPIVIRTMIRSAINDRIGNGVLGVKCSFRSTTIIFPDA